MVLVKLSTDEPGVSVIPTDVDMNHGVPVPVIVQVPLPIFNARVPPPEPSKLSNVTLLLLTLKSRIQPVVDAVQAPIVIEMTLTVVLTVMVQVTPPTQVAAFKVTVSAAPGTEAPVAPPLEVDHMRVLDASQVQAAVHTAKREAASV